MTTRIPLDKIAPDPKQPRKQFTDAELNELADSIAAQGLLQSIVVRPTGKGAYMIVAGERRWRAHKLLRAQGLRRFAAIACEVRKISAAVDIRLAQLVENIQRAEMTPHEEANAFAELVEMGLTVPEIASKLGLAEFRVKWRLQLLNLSPEVRRLSESGHLDRQQSLEIARLDRPADQRRLVQLINRGDVIGWKATRNAVDSMIAGTTAADLFGDAAPRPHSEEIAVVRSMEDRVERVVAMVASGWRDGECIIASKINPDRAVMMADRLAALRGALAAMERELRNATAQAKIVLAG